MIQRKKKICKTCDTEQYLFSRGNCQRCAQKVAPKTKKNNAKRTERLSTFFPEAIRRAELNPYSIESGKFISNISHWNIAHILPKRSFKDLMDDQDNWILFTIEEHTDFDHLLDSNRFQDLEVKFPNSWNKIRLKIVELMKKTVTRNNLYWKFEEYYETLR